MVNNQEFVKKEPLIHITKRTATSWKRAIAVRAIAVLCALLFAAVVIMALTGQNPIKIYSSMLSGAFGSSRRIWNLLNEVCILLGLSLAVTPAFRMRFWNCGAQGQTLIGGLATVACMWYLGDRVPLPLLFVFMIIASVLAGALWGVIPSIFKALFGTNETLFTLMMNYIAIQLIAFFIKLWVPSGSGTVPVMAQYKFPKLFGQPYLLNIIVILAVCGMMYIYLRYSKQGYEISVVGESENTAKYVGINVKKVVIRTMILSGALCGLVGLLLVANGSGNISTDIEGGRGFTAIMVSWLAKFNPLFMIMTSFLVGFLSRGADQIATDFRLDSAICDILVAIILFFIIGCEFFVNYRIHFRKKDKGGRAK